MWHIATGVSFDASKGIDARHVDARALAANDRPTMWSALDQRLFAAWYAPHEGGAWFIAMYVATWLGSGWSLFALAPLFARAQTRRFATALFWTLATTALLVFLAKLAVHRPRPPFALPHVHAWVGDPHDFSFPSGHASGSFAFAAFVIAVLRTRARELVGATSLTRFAVGTAAPGALVGLATLVGLSRVVLGCHFPGDVAAGALLGAAAGGIGARRYLTARAALKKEPKAMNLALSPTADTK